MSEWSKVLTASAVVLLCGWLSSCESLSVTPEVAVAHDLQGKALDRLYEGRKVVVDAYDAELRRFLDRELALLLERELARRRQFTFRAPVVLPPEIAAGFQVAPDQSITLSAESANWLLNYAGTNPAMLTESEVLALSAQKDEQRAKVHGELDTMKARFLSDENYAAARELHSLVGTWLSEFGQLASRIRQLSSGDFETLEKPVAPAPGLSGVK